MHVIDQSGWRGPAISTYAATSICVASSMLQCGRKVLASSSRDGTRGEPVRLDTDDTAGWAGNASLDAVGRALGSNSFKDRIRMLAIRPGAVDTERPVTPLQTRAGTRPGDAARWHALVTSLPYGLSRKCRRGGQRCRVCGILSASNLSGIVINVDGGHHARGGAFRHRMRSR